MIIATVSEKPASAVQAYLAQILSDRGCAWEGIRLAVESGYVFALDHALDRESLQSHDNADSDFFGHFGREVTQEVCDSRVHA